MKRNSNFQSCFSRYNC